MRNAQKVEKGDILVGNNTDNCWYVDSVSSNGNMTISELPNGDKERVSVTMANSCMIYRDIAEIENNQ